MGDVNNVRHMVVEGKVEGDINVETLVLKDFSVIRGDIVCKSLVVNPTSTVVGRVRVLPAGES